MEQPGDGRAWKIWLQLS